MCTQELCRVLSALQQDAPAHSFEQSKRQIEAAFRRPLADVFEEFDEKPVASASIAQVCMTCCIIKPQNSRKAVPDRLGLCRLVTSRPNVAP